MKRLRTISLCITTFNRVDMTVRSFEKVANDPRISDIIILDDASDGLLYHELALKLAPFEKVQRFRLPENRGVYHAKKHAIALAFNEWCILLDSDNIIGTDYIDALYAIPEWEHDTSYLPSFAKPIFDYRHFSGLTFTKENVAGHLEDKMFDCLINTMNGFYNKDQYWKVWDGSVEPLTADSMYMNYLLLKAGNQLSVVPGLEYEHAVHDGSHYKKYSSGNEAFKNYVLNLYKKLE